MDYSDLGDLTEFSDSIGTMGAAVTISGSWEPSFVSLGALGLGEHRHMQFVQTSYRLFGIDWWAERVSYDVVITGWDPEIGEVTFSIVSDVVTERSEWWRRAGCAVLSRINAVWSRIGSWLRTT